MSQLNLEKFQNFNLRSGLQNNSGGRGGEERGILQLITTAC